MFEPIERYLRFKLFEVTSFFKFSLSEHSNFSRSLLLEKSSSFKSLPSQSKILNFLKLQNEEMFNNFFNTQVTPSQMSIGKWKNMNDWKEFDKKYNFILKNLEFQNIFIERYY